ncbi:valine--tRNA ligase [Spirulina major]|uniref:valine--tRNA ligase n=1 Tax=Spirulina major TaxID=270636 RepID=UPI0009328EA3|nr:valine--tRNA ligase [Spirulina major]
MTASIPTLAPQYDPTTTESKWQTHWETQQVFHAHPNPGKESYSIVIPPPNVTGRLHMGHAFNTALIDTLVRYHRMLGKDTLCLPGTDHASIAVQTILERQLREEGTNRDAVGREEFLKRAWEWRSQSGGAIVDQLRRLGLSADWSRERFTLDETLCEAVVTAFVKLYDDGLIYRGNYLVNWCPASQSAVSDLEVEPKEVDGHLWHFRYPLSNGSGFVEVATTRPETMLGDTAVAVNPKDERYQGLIGKMLTLPILGRQIPVIGDDLVDPEFGTGCVKVTPAHDPNDFEMGQRHNLPMITILNKDGTINPLGGKFAGQDRFEARKNVVATLDELGALVKVEPYHHTVPHSDRGKVPIEPLLSTQWFVKIDPLAQTALTELDQHNSPQFVPERWTKVYRDWLVRLKDWCISRQLWWGHQIPAWYVINQTNGKITDQTPFIVAHNEAEAWEKAKAQYGEDVQLERDPDVLDTWFSSGLWPFSTMGWPAETDDLAAYFPNATLVTGFDIIFFWVARMTMMSGYFTGKMPFQDIYIHGLVRDENGKKMSKSANNGIDPLLLINKYGADALRYTLIKEVAGAGQDISLQYDRSTDESESVEASRNFANKLWNAARFVMMNLEGQTPVALGVPDALALELSDRWILSRFYHTVTQTRDYLEQYGLGEAAKGLYEFIWGDFCDWYIELVKPRLRDGADPQSRHSAQQTLAYVLEGTLKLLHPFMPHITEEIWQTLTQADGVTLATQPYPVVDEILAHQPEDEAPPSSDAATASDETAAERPEPEIKIPVREEYDNPVIQFIADLPYFFSTFTAQNQRLLLAVAIAGVGFVSLKVLASLLNTLDKIPFIAPGFQLVGFGVITWFVITRLLRSEPRRKSLQQVQSLWKSAIGNVEEQWAKVTHSDPSEPAATSAPATAPVRPYTLVNPTLETDFALLIGTIRTVRNLRAEADIKPGVNVPILLQSDQASERDILTAGRYYIQSLAKGETVTITSALSEESSNRSFGSVYGTVQVLIPLQGLVDLDALRDKLTKKLSKVEKEAESLTGRLNNANFVNKAPEEVVEGARLTLAAANKQAEILRDRLMRLQ